MATEMLRFIKLKYKMKPKKIAIFHNYMDSIGGAEMVVLTLARELKADVYTTNIDLEKIKKMGFSNIKIKSIGKAPINAPFRMQVPLYRFRKLKLKGYDFYIIAGDWAISAAVNNKPNLEYFHSPVNELWEFKEYVRAYLKPWQRPIFDLWVWFNRRLYREYFKHVEKKVANSRNTQNRIKKYLKSDSVVINPPIETSKYKYKKTGDFWLSVNRLFKNKRVNMQIKAFRSLPNEKLIIVGSYEMSKHFHAHADYIKKMKPENVEILSWVDDKKLKELYANCKGFITTAIDEDFGMTPVEAMASGKPVIAGNEGGYKETVIDGKTGILINDINEKKLAEAIKKMSKELKNKKVQEKYKKACQKRAKEFDTKIFIKKIKKEIGK